MGFCFNHLTSSRFPLLGNFILHHLPPSSFSVRRIEVEASPPPPCTNVALAEPQAPVAAFAPSEFSDVVVAAASALSAHLVASSAAASAICLVIQTFLVGHLAGEEGQPIFLPPHNLCPLTGAAGGLVELFCYHCFFGCYWCS